MSLSITVDRSSLSLADLVFGDTPAAGLWLPEDGLQQPAKQWNRVTVTSPWTHGEVLTSATLEQSSLPFTLYAQAATTADLRTLRNEVEDALFQFAYPVTLTVDGDATTWDAEPADIAWGNVDSGLVAACMATATITIPVYPVSA